MVRKSKGRVYHDDLYIRSELGVAFARSKGAAEVTECGQAVRVPSDISQQLIKAYMKHFVSPSIVTVISALRSSSARFS